MRYVLLLAAVFGSALNAALPPAGSTVQQIKAPQVPATITKAAEPSQNSESAFSPPTRLEHPLDDWPQISARIWSKVRVCENCHSGAMIGQNRFIPILQGQQRNYLYSKIQSFKTHRKSRHPFPMFTQRLGDDDIIDIALFYALQRSPLSLNLVRIEPNWRQEGAALERPIEGCLDCHGADGNGSGLIPALSGQSRRYLAYRMREIGDGSSDIHVHSDAPLSCGVQPFTVRQARHTANRLALVVDTERLSEGESIYQKQCQSCHDVGGGAAPRLDVNLDWHSRLEEGVLHYATLTAERRFDAHESHIEPRLSRRQWQDVLQYVVARIAKSEAQ